MTAFAPEQVVNQRVWASVRLAAGSAFDETARLTGAEIRFLRKHLGWSAEAFAGVIGVRPETVSRWENEKEPMGATSERLLRLMALRLKPVESYPNERLADVAKEDARPVALRLRVDKAGWHAENVAA